MNYFKIPICLSFFVLFGCNPQNVSQNNQNSNLIPTNNNPSTQSASSSNTNNIVSFAAQDQDLETLDVENSCFEINFDNLLVNYNAAEVESSVADCLKNANVRYSFAKALFDNGMVEESLKQLQQIPDSKDNSSELILLETSDLVKRMDSPFSYAAEVANSKLEKWLTRPSDIPAFDLKPPTRPNPPSPPVVVRSEFETSDIFLARKKRTEANYINQIKQLELEYQQTVEDYNSNVGKYNAALQWEIKSRQERADLMRNKFLIDEIENALGQLLIDNLNYNADEQIYYADLISSQSNYQSRIVIEVPLEDAQLFKADANGIFPNLEFAIENKQLKINKINVPYNGKVYQAKITDKSYNFSPSREVISIKTLGDLKVNPIAPNQSFLRNQMNIDGVVNKNRNFFQNAVQ